MPSSRPVLVTGAAGQVGGIGRLLVEILRDRGVPVRAVVRSDDDALLRCGCAGRKSPSPI